VLFLQIHKAVTRELVGIVLSALGNRCDVALSNARECYFPGLRDREEEKDALSFSIWQLQIGDPRPGRSDRCAAGAAASAESTIKCRFQRPQCPLAASSIPSPSAENHKERFASAFFAAQPFSATYPRSASPRVLRISPVDRLRTSRLGRGQSNTPFHRRGPDKPARSSRWHKATNHAVMHRAFIIEARASAEARTRRRRMDRGPSPLAQATPGPACLSSCR